MKVKKTTFKVPTKEKKILARFGLGVHSFSKYETIKDLNKCSPSMVTTSVCRPGTAIIDGKHEVNMRLGDIYVMNYGLFKRINNNNTYLEPYKKKFSQFFKRYYNNDLSGKKILFTRMGGLGDILFSQTCIKYLKNRYPDCQIDYATSPNNIEFFQSWESGLVENVLPIPYLLSDLKRYDYHATFEGSIERCHEAERLNCYDIFRKVLGLDFNVYNYLPNLVPLTNLVDELKDLVPDNMIVIHMKSTSPLRNMEVPKWGRIVNSLIDLGYNVGIVDSPGSYMMYEDFITRFNFPRTKIFNFSNVSKSINHAIAIASLSKGLIGIDSSMTHIFGALDKPLVGLYGPFLSELRLKYYKYAIGINADEFDNCCEKYPCFFHTPEIFECPTIKKNNIPACLSSLNETKIIESLEKVIRMKNESESVHEN